MVDHLVALYTRSGKLVDRRIILRHQDYYDGDIQETSKPYSLNVKHIHTIGTEFDRRLTFLTGVVEIFGGNVCEIQN